jgi:glycosyltransferase involved in cell wall biosynthesis
LLLKYLKRQGHHVSICTNGGDSLDRVKELGIPVYTNRSLSAKSSFIKSINYLTEITQKEETQIVHSHHRYYELLANSLKKNKKIHTVFTALSIVDKRYFIEYKSDRIIAISKCVKEMLTDKFGVDESRISQIPNFADSEELLNQQHSKTKESKPSYDGKIVILSVGRYHREKDFETLLRAVSLINDYRIKLLLIGEGEDKAGYERMIEEFSLDVDLIEPQRYLQKYFNAADMCVLSSVRDPLPGFMLQSGLHKKAFIGSDVDGIQELIIDGKNGLLFRRKDERELADRITRFITNKELAEKCALALNQLVISGFTENTVIPEIEELYLSLIN